MSTIQTIKSAKVWTIWKITAKYLKAYRHKLKSKEEYDYYSYNIIAFFRDYEAKIHSKNIPISKLKYIKELNQLITKISKKNNLN